MMFSNNEVTIREDNGKVVNLPVIQWKGQRIVTLQDIAELHRANLKTVQRDFTNNLGKRFIENKHYFRFEGKNGREALLDANSEFRSLLEKRLGNAIRWLRIGLTESGYLRLCKIMTDDVSWSVQEQLINSYYRMKALEQDPFVMLHTVADRLTVMFNEMQQAIRLNDFNYNNLVEVQGEINDEYDNTFAELKSSIESLPASKSLTVVEPEPINRKTMFIDKQSFHALQNRYNTMQKALSHLQHEIDTLKKHQQGVSKEIPAIDSAEQKNPEKTEKISDNARKAYWERFAEHRTCKSLAQYMGLITYNDHPHHKFIGAICKELGYYDGDGYMKRTAYKTERGEELFTNMILTDQGIEGVVNYWNNIMDSYKIILHYGISCCKYVIGNRNFYLKYDEIVKEDLSTSPCLTHA